MAFYDKLFNGLGLRGWCDSGGEAGLMSMSDLLAQTGNNADTGPAFPFPSLDNLNKACDNFPQSRELTAGVENAFLAIKDPLKLVLDPLTQPLSWLLEGALFTFGAIPWWILLPTLFFVTWYVSRSVAVTVFVAVSLLFIGFIDHLEATIQTLSIIFVCTGLSVLFGVPIGIAMSKSNTLQRMTIPLLDLLQTLPSFVYLIPLIFLFSVIDLSL